MNDATTVNSSHLCAFIERMERLEEEKRALAEDITEIFAEAKRNGFDSAILRKIDRPPLSGPAATLVH